MPLMERTDEHWMNVALEAAREAAAIGEVPVGACIVSAEGTLLAAASNRTITDSDPTAHAEVLAIRAAGIALSNYRLIGTTLYTTVEPCVMCAGAIVNARVARLVYGAADPRFGAVDTHFNLCSSPLLNHRLTITPNILADHSRNLMQNFFRSRRS
ncbi:MAG: tRNA adenosine(34) deaminase TadA [Acidobacteria bacterium]|nr:tRNA adenosine(34) deaminase TadA [Acidobacteriota bacterium]